MKKMKIAQIGPLWENIPPPKYGGTERIVYYLVEGLIKNGYEVTLFASGTSKTSAKLISVSHQPLFRKKIPWTNIMYPLLNITEAFDRQKNFDIIHVHLNIPSDYVSLPLASQIKNKVVFTLHFPYPISLGYADRHLVLQKYRHLNYVSISDSQRKGGKNLNWIKTVYNGVDINSYNFNPQPDNYFVWLGKFKPQKGVKEAIIAAKKAGVKLIIGGTIDYLEKDYFAYFQNEVEPLIDGKQIKFVGELNDKQKNEIYGKAVCFLNPISWEEPFGLVMIEAMACGTPVIAFARGAAKEIVKDGETGYLVNDIDQMVEAIKKIGSIDRKKCRERIEKNFTTDIMVKNYEEVYRQILKIPSV